MPALRWKKTQGIPTTIHRFLEPSHLQPGKTNLNKLVNIFHYFDENGGKGCKLELDLGKVNIP